MAFISDTLTSVNRTAIDVLTATQDRVLASNRRAAALVAKAPALPSWLTPFARPVDRDLLSQTFDVNIQAVDATKRFALALVEVWTPAAGSRA